MNRIPKQKEVQEVLRSNGINFCAILESHLVNEKLKKVCDHILGRWNWISNNRKCVGGIRIILGWDPGIVDLMILSLTDQLIRWTIGGSYGKILKSINDLHYINRGRY